MVDDPPGQGGSSVLLLQREKTYKERKGNSKRFEISLSRQQKVKLIAVFCALNFCLIQDDTILTAHCSILICAYVALYVVNCCLLDKIETHLADRRYLGRLFLLTMWGVLLFVYPFAGLLRMVVALGMIQAVIMLWYQMSSLLLRNLLCLYLVVLILLCNVAPIVTIACAICILWLGRLIRYQASVTAPSTNVKSASDDEQIGVLKEVAQSLALAPIFGVLAAFIVYWIMLSMNSFWMDMSHFSKFHILQTFGKNLTLNAQEISTLNLDSSEVARFRGAHYPLVIKPSVCTTNSRNVKKCNDFNCLETYLNKRAFNLQRGDDSWVVQEFHPGVEMVVFYYRPPYQSNGYVKTVGLRQPSGRLHSPSQTLKADYFTSVKVDHSELKTSALTRFFDQQADKLNGYHGGRFDCIIESESLAKEGKGIHILEANLFPLGDIKEKIAHNSDPFVKYTTFTPAEIRTWQLQFWIGTANILGGYHATKNPIHFIVNSKKVIHRWLQCNNHEGLLAKP